MSSNKNKKKQQTGGLQPKGGAYAGQKREVEDLLIENNNPTDIKAAQKERAKAEKERIKTERAKAKEKAKREKGEKKKKGGLVKSLRETGSELKKVQWPKFKTVVKQTGVVLGVVVIFSIIVFGIDRGLGALYDLLVRNLGGG